MISEKFHSFEPLYLPFEMLTSGISENDNHYIVERENSPFYILEYVCSGSGVVICNGIKYNVNAGDCYLLSKHSNHSYFSNDNWTKIWFNVDGILVSNLIHSYQFEDIVVFKNFNNKECFEKLYDITSSETIDTEIALKSAMQFHYILQQLYISQATHNISMADKVKKFIDSNLNKQKISIRALSDELFISQTTLIEEFKKKYHSTPYQYFINKRISLAVSMLMNSNMSITEIAEALGYSDSASFSNAFKKNTGLSPKDYKKINLHPSSFKFYNITEEN